MADPVALQIRTPNAMETIGNIVNIARGQQDYQRGAVALEKEKALLQPGIAQGVAQSKTAEEQARQAEIRTNLDKFKLTGDYAQKARDISQQLVNDPDVINGNADGIVTKIAAARQMMIESGIPPAIAEVQAAHLMQAAAQNPKGIRQALLNSIQAGIGSTGQAANIREAGVPVTNQQQTSVVSTNPFSATPVGQPIAGTPQQQLISPSEQETVSINPITRAPMTTTKDTSGRVTGVTQTPTGKGVPQLAPGQPEDIPILTNLRATINTAAAKVPESHFNNSQIIKLADETNTGKGAAILQNMKGGYAGIPWTADTAKNYNSLGHFIALEAQNNAKAMGAGTDAARDLSSQATASTGWTKDAIKTAAKVNDALATGLDYFNRGMEKAIAANDGNILAVRGFQNAWSQAFDPNVYRYANALQANDKAEIAKILGPEGSAQRKAKAGELARKSATLYRLSEQGQ